MMNDALIVLGAYLVGSVSFAVIVSRMYALPDPHSYGSGNPGATNVLRTGHKGAAVLTLIGDTGKGVVAVLLARALSGEAGAYGLVVPLAALAAFVGHLYPVFHGFRGGKGVATLVGAYAGIDLFLLLPLFVCWFAVAAVSGFVGLSSIVASLAIPIYILIRDGGQMTPALGFALACAALVIWTHRGNVRRMRAGIEPRARRLWLFGRNT